MVQKTFLVVGLGNPEEKYNNTFHNVGFAAADRFARLIDASFDKGECRAITAHKKTPVGKIIIAKPITYMNLSGESVRELVNKYKICQPSFIVVYDDADLPTGKVRIRKEGSGGSHNGMKNIVDNFGTQNIYRIRIGIDRPKTEGFALMDYVLSRIPDEAAKELDAAYDVVACALKDFCDGYDIDAVMRKYNHK